MSKRKGLAKSIEVEGKGKAIDILLATKYLGFSYSIYTRRLYLEGKLEGVKKAIGKREKVFLLVSSLDSYKARVRVRTSKRRYLLYIDLELESKVRELLDRESIEYKLELAYKGAEEEVS